MRFYRFNLKINDTEWEEAANNHETYREKKDEIAAKSISFNEGRKGTFIYVSAALRHTFEGGMIIDSEEVDPNALLNEYLESLQIKPGAIELSEALFRNIERMLYIASRNDLIADRDDVLEAWGLDMLSESQHHELQFGENLVDGNGKEKNYALSEDLLSENTLKAELDRIYQGRKNRKAKGHPVHYYIETDDTDTRKRMCRLLLDALYDTGRIKNRRYSFFNSEDCRHVISGELECLYKSNTGGAVIIRYNRKAEDEDNRASSGRYVISKLCDAMKKYSNEVLTIFCLPKEGTKVKELFREHLGSMALIELVEEPAYGEAAVAVLKRMAKEKGVSSDKILLTLVKPDTGYFMPELREIFEEWYSRKLRTGVYPQYKSVVTVRKKLQKEKPKGNAYNELMDMIGLEEAKKVLNRAVAYHKAQKVFAEKGMKSDRVAMHMVFTGNPGTAKTTAARLFARIMRENSLLSTGHLVECGRGDLVGKYVGWTAPAIQEKFKEAKGGVLFIDEAYSLVDDRDGSYGDEAINTIVQEMENHRKDMIVIFAGYPDKMEGFLQKNPGLRSRIAFHVPFPDYSVEELSEIAEHVVKEKEMGMTAGAQEKLRGILEEACGEEDFGNGRFVRNMIEKAKMAQAMRLMELPYEQVSRKDVATICAEDIEEPDFLKKKAENSAIIGFRAG